MGDDPDELTFTVAVDDAKFAHIDTRHAPMGLQIAEDQTAARRVYIHFDGEDETASAVVQGACIARLSSTVFAL